MQAMTNNETLLYEWLKQACALISVEARDHEENKLWDDRKQRQAIAETLRSFLTAAERATKHLKDQ